MTVSCFLDSSILIYAALKTEGSTSKKAIAKRIIETEEYSTSAQVLAEFYVNVMEKGQPFFTHEKAAEWIRQIARKPCEPVDVPLVKAGTAMAERYQLSYWDGTILAAAERLNAGTVYSEDMNHGQLYGAVTVINPFLET